MSIGCVARAKRHLHIVKLAMMKSFEIVCVLLGFLFVCLGLLGRTTLMSQNPCQMTYTTMQKSEVNVSTELPDVGTLYRHPMGTKLSKYPVLFIPGNMGSADQVRSLSSPMHNKDDFFQFFAVHFKKPLSAIHGSVLLSQAAFVNDALDAIRALYKKPVKIIMVGHSLGGMVARTAMTLSNHPKSTDQQCIISDIVMLNTPNRGPAYSPDGSMEAIYSAVNKVWRESYYNESVNCKRSRLEANDPILARSGKNAISMNQKCTLCTSKVRLLSISGGDLDILVPAHLTPIDVVAPLARNITQMYDNKKTGSIFGGKSVLRTALSWLSPSALFRGVLSIVSSSKRDEREDTKQNFSASVKDSVKERSTGNEDKSVREDTEKIAVSATSATSATSGDSATDPQDSVGEGEGAKNSTGQPEANITIDKKDPVYRLSLEEWNAHIAPYEESVQFSMRSVQLKGVGFPIDHNALLWCRQLMGQVIQTMMKLVDKDEKARKNGHRDDAGLTSVALTKMLPLGQSSRGRAIISRATTEAKTMIAPVAAFLMRNATINAFSSISEEEDRLYMAKILPLGYVQALAVSYVSTRWVTETLQWYMLLAIMALVVPIRRKLLSLDHKERSDDWSILTLFALLHLEDLAPALGTVAHAVFSVLLPPAILESPAYRDWFPSGLEKDKGKTNRGDGAIAVMLSISGAVVARFLLDLWWQDAGSFHSTLVRYNYRRWLHIVISLFSAILVRAILLVAIYGARGSVRLVIGILRAIFRFTVYRKSARRLFKRIRRSITGNKGTILPHGFYIPTVFLTTASSIVSHAWLIDSVAVRELGFGYWAFLTVILSTGVTAVIAVIRTLISPPYDDSAEAYHLHTSLGLLYLPLVVLSVPTIGFTAFALLGGGSRTIKPILPSFFIFSTSEMNVFLSIICVVLHLWIATSYGPAYASLQDSQPLQWLSINVLGRTPPKISNSTSGGSNKSGAGIHSFWDAESDSDDDGEHEEQGFEGTLRINGECYHEDGGRGAIFEEVTIPRISSPSKDLDDGGDNNSGTSKSIEGLDNKQTAMSPSHKAKRKSRVRVPTQEKLSSGVIIGTTYRVVDCACAKDYRLKDQTEWCSFCRCKFCGGKHLRQAGGEWHSDFGNSRNGTRGRLLLDDISANAYLAISLVMLGLSSPLYAGHMPHRHLYLAGAVAFAFMLRDMACTFGLLKP